MSTMGQVYLLLAETVQPNPWSTSRDRIPFRAVATVSVRLLIGFQLHLIVLLLIRQL